MIQEHAHVPKTLRNVLTPSVSLSVQSCVCGGGAPVHVCDGHVQRWWCDRACLLVCPAPLIQEGGNPLLGRRSIRIKGL